MRDHITRLNTMHGICGFASALSAMYEHNNEIWQTLRAIETDQDLLTRTWAEIVAYLRELQHRNQVLLDAIIAFTTTFPGYADMDLERTIEEFEAVVRAGGFFEIAGELLSVGIAMPPEAIVDFLVTRGTNARLIHQDAEDFNLIFPNVILGLAGGNEQRNQIYNGLVHWVYKQQGVVYNYGEIDQINDQQNPIVYKIVI